MTKMQKKLAILLVLLLFFFFEAFLSLLPTATKHSVTATVEAQQEPSTELFSPDQLDNLLAPIALYPDPLLAQVLLAATYMDQVDEASRWLRATNNANAIDAQPWDVSVKAVAHYPAVLYMMSDQLDWTTSVGQAYVYQSTDVMTSVQRLRAQAYSLGNLVTTEQQEIIIDDGTIDIFPAQAQYIYVPTYDPYIIYYGPAGYFGFYPATIMYFGPPFFIGAWLNYACDWHRHRIYYHGWRGAGWIARSRPVIHVNNVYINSGLANVRINRNIVHRPVNYINLNRYNSVHREVSYNNLIRGTTRNLGNADAGNKVIRRNLDVTDPRLDVYRGRPSIEQPPTRGVGPSPPAATAHPPMEMREARPPVTQPQPMPVPRGQRPQIALPPPQPPSQRPPATVFGGSGSVFDPRAASQRGQESRRQIIQPTAPSRPTIAPRIPATRAPSMPGRR